MEKKLRKSCYSSKIEVGLRRKKIPDKNEKEQGTVIEIDIRFLYPGTILKGDGYDEAGNKVIDKRVPITKDIIEDLKRKNVKTVSYTRERPQFKRDDGGNGMISREHLEAAMETVDNIEWAIKAQRAKLPVKAVQEVIEDIFSDIRKNPEACLNLLELSEHDDYSYTHSINVCMLCTYLGYGLTLSREENKNLGIAGLLHDVGKLKISNEIIQKPGPLDEEEWVEIKKHPEYGYNILKNNEKLSENILKGVLFHHEDYDGSGYPYGVTGEKTNEFAHCIAVCDCFDAMTTDKPYASAKSYSEAFYYILEQTGKKFHPRIAQAFLKEIVARTNEDPLYPEGSYVVLNTGEIGNVVGHSVSPYSLRPIIEIFFDMRKADKFLPRPLQIDLESDYARQIVKRLTDNNLITKFDKHLGKS